MTRTTDPFRPVEQEPLLIVISGPSGVGKDSIIQRMKSRSLPVHFVVTATTRAARPEEDGLQTRNRTAGMGEVCARPHPSFRPGHRGVPGVILPGRRGGAGHVAQVAE